MPGKITRLRTALVAVAMLVGIVGVAGCSGTGQSGQSVDNKVGNTGDPGAYYWTPGHRQAVHDVTGPAVQGGTFNLASYRGKWVVVNYWSSSCGPCRSEEQGFEALAKMLAPQGVQFVGIDVRDDLAAAQNFERYYHVSYPSLFDQDDSSVLDFPGAVPSTTPFTIVIDPQGGIAARQANSLDFTTLRSFINHARSLKA